VAAIDAFLEDVLPAREDRATVRPDEAFTAREVELAGQHADVRKPPRGWWRWVGPIRTWRMNS
jgi:hypothetical protein